MTTQARRNQQKYDMAVSYHKRAMDAAGFTMVAYILHWMDCPNPDKLDDHELFQVCKAVYEWCVHKVPISRNVISKQKRLL